MSPATLVETDEGTGLTATHTTDPAAMKRWFLRPFVMRWAMEGVAKPQTGIFDGDGWDGVLITNRTGGEVGAIAFFDSPPRSCYIHLALSTYGKRSEVAFRLACKIAARLGYKVIKFFFNINNKQVEHFAQRLGLLKDAQLITVDSSLLTGQWWTGDFKSCHF